MIKYFGIHSEQKVYIGTIVPMPPNVGMRKTSCNIPGMCTHIWLKVFMNKPMQECRDVRKFQVSTNNNKKVSLLIS